MTFPAVEIVCDAMAVLGEGPVWDDDRLLWVDIGTTTVHRPDSATGKQESTRADRAVGALSPLIS